uniref:ATPase, vacuolar ER assembly factor, Vma12 n=1 Tax=Physcomitrium patens TaxID=3218 RepID=A0A7I4BDD9_PHYPA
MGFEGNSRLFALESGSTATGLVLHSCPNIKSLLSNAASSEKISVDLRDAALLYLDAPSVPYPIIRDTWAQLTPGYGVPFHQVLAGSSFVLESPKPREKSKELVDRLAKLQDLADKNAYKELVKDVTKSADDDREYFSSYKNSLGFGYMFGYAIVRSQFPESPPMHAVGGVFGLIAGMFVETILFITRAQMAEKRQQLRANVKAKAGKQPPSNFEPVANTSSNASEILDYQSEIQEEEASTGIRQRRGVPKSLN